MTTSKNNNVLLAAILKAYLPEIEEERALAAANDFTDRMEALATAPGVSADEIEVIASGLLAWDGASTARLAPDATIGSSFAQ